jgi:hypothetical protein
MIIDMKDGRIIEDRRKNVQADYDHPKDTKNYPKKFSV